MPKHQAQLTHRWRLFQLYWQRQQAVRAQLFLTSVASVVVAGLLLATIATERLLGPPILSILLIALILRIWRNSWAAGLLLVWSTWLLSAAYQASVWPVLLVLSTVVVFDQMVGPHNGVTIKTTVLAVAAAILLTGSVAWSWWWLGALISIVGYRLVIRLKWPVWLKFWRR